MYSLKETTAQGTTPQYLQTMCWLFAVPFNFHVEETRPPHPNDAHDYISQHDLTSYYTSHLMLLMTRAQLFERQLALTRG